MESAADRTESDRKTKGRLSPAAKSYLESLCE